MIYTSYFAKIRKFPDNVIPVSIARFTPKGVNIPVLTELAPTKGILFKYKADNNKEDYIRDYNEQILDKLSAFKIINMIENATGLKDISVRTDKHVALCCFEKSEDFCHRHLIADYMEKQGIKIQELDDKTIEKLKENPNVLK